RTARVPAGARAALGRRADWASAGAHGPAAHHLPGAVPDAPGPPLPDPRQLGLDRRLRGLAPARLRRGRGMSPRDPRRTARRIERRNAQFQQWQALLTNRTKRSRAGEMLVQGVRPITQAIDHGHEIRALLTDSRENPSRWARELLESSPAPVVHLAPELMAELGEKEDGAPELLAVAAMPADDLSRLEAGPRSTVVVFDRPTGPGNIGSLARS